jgi:protein SCO1
MSKKAILALSLAVLLPVVSYFLVSGFSEDAVNIPRRYFADTVINSVVNGKSRSDTVWHKVSNISLTNQLGQTVSFDDLQGKVLVIDFFFTRCPSICPALTNNMKRLEKGMKVNNPRRRIDSSFVHFISMSVDPERDSATVLKKYGDRYGINPDVWWLLTGPKKSIYDFAFGELKLGIQDGNGIDSNFLHTDKFILLDKDRVVRGYYDGLDTASLARLAEDITIVMLEKDPKRKRKIF